MIRFLLLGMIILDIFCTSAYAETVLITAATGSFGKAISFNLASEGYDLLLAGRNQDKLNNLKKELLNTYKNATISTIILDFSDIEKIRSLLAKASFNQLCGIVLIGPRPELSKNDIPSPEEWLKSFKETFIAPLETLRLLIPHLKENSSIVVISGNSSKDYSKDYPNINVIRLAWSGEVKNLMHFVASRKIRVNAVSPGPILTQQHIDTVTNEAAKNKTSFDEQLKKNTASIPLGTYGSLDDVSHLVHFLISNRSNYINGSNILLDGGAYNGY